MNEQTISHALGLHMHQPPGNLKLLIEENPWEAEQIIRCYERVPRNAQNYSDIGHLHVGFSGILLEQFLDPGIVDAYRHITDIPAMLESYRNSPNIELIGMGYYHPIFPLIPQQDWADQLLKGRQIMQKSFGREPRGFWPPEMAFTMEMIPALITAGYEYVVVDSVHVQPEDGEHDIYRPYKACHAGDCITIIPRDRDLSNAQESGLDPSWFANEIQHKVWQSPRPHEPRLVTTWSDGENGGWFRQTDESSGFFGFFFAPYMEHARHGEFPARTVSISEYLEDHQAEQEAHVQTGAWNVGDTSGYDFAQWAGSDSQRKAVTEIVKVSDRFHQLSAQKTGDKSVRKILEQAHQVMLEGQTSCYLFWGDSWIPHLYEHTKQVGDLLDKVEKGGKAIVNQTDTPKDVPNVVKTESATSIPIPKSEQATTSQKARTKAFPNPVKSAGKTGPATAATPTPALAKKSVAKKKPLDREKTSPETSAPKNSEVSHTKTTKKR